MILFIIRHPLYFVLSFLLHMLLIGLFYLQAQVEKPLSMPSKTLDVSKSKFNPEDALKKKLDKPMRTYIVDSKLVQSQLEKVKRQSRYKKQQQIKQQQQIINDKKRILELQKRKQLELAKVKEAEIKQQQVELEKNKIEKEILRKSAEKKNLEEAAIKAKMEAERLEEEVRLQKQQAELESKKRQLEKKVQLDDLRKIYIASIAAKVRENWRTPVKVSNKAECELLITQTPKGYISSVKVGVCNQYATPQFKKAAEDAVYRTDPIPKPPKKEMFERNIRFIFKP